MCHRLLQSMITVAIAAGGTVISMSVTASDQLSVAPATAQAATPKTPWGEPDLQGIWMDEVDTPLQRPAKYAGQEFFTATQREELDRERSELGRDSRGEHGTEADLAGADNTFGWYHKRTAARTSLIVDPPDGRIPALTAEAQKAAAADREFRLVTIQATETCRTELAQCKGGRYDSVPSPRRSDPPPRYNASESQRYNRREGPEDGSLSERCLSRGLPELSNALGGSLRRIVQTPGGISIYYEIPFGQGFQRNIVLDGSPHLPASIRQWFGDSRGYWEGDTLVIDVTNFSPKTDFEGSRENLHLVERWTRTGPATLDYVVTIEDPTVWTRPWTVRQDLIGQSDQANRIYYEPRCVEANYSLPTILLGSRTEELAFKEGRGPDPATRDSVFSDRSTRFDPLR
jgi:hypothetical protein